MSRPIEHNYKRISTAVRMSAELHERLKAAARERDLAANYMMVRAIEEFET